MALFKDSSMAKQANASAPGQINMVGQGTVVEGTLRAENDIRVSGRIVGKLHVEGKAMIAQEGLVEGELVATSADVAGSVQGELRISERLVLKSSARIDGDIRTERLIVEEGAVFTGQCEMGETAHRNGQADSEQEPAELEEEETGGYGSPLPDNEAVAKE